MKHALFLSILSCAWAQSGIDVPAIGIVADPSGSLRAVQGVAGNFLLGPPIATGVLSAACSEQLCLAKTDSRILSATGQADAPPGRAIFGFDGDRAIVFFAESRAFARWNKDRLEPLDWTVDDDVLSILTGNKGIEVALRRDWAAVTNGPVLLLREGVLFATADELVFRHRDGSEARFELTGGESITPMGPHYAAIRAGAVTFALRLDPGYEQLFLLPGSAP